MTMQTPDSRNSGKKQTPGDMTFRKKETQDRLIRFFIFMLAAILFSELLILFIINQTILPAIQASFFAGVTWETPLTGTQLAVLVTGTCLILFLQPFSAMSPATFPFQERLNLWILRRVPQLTSLLAVQDLERSDMIQLIFISFGLLFLELLPFLIFGGLYIRFVLRTTEQALLEDEQQYRELDREKNLMLADMAHDIRNPMTTITGYAQALEDGMIRDPEKQREYLAAIRMKSERVNTLIDALFEYTKLNSTGFSLEKHPVDLCELLRESAAELYTDAEEKGIEILTSIPEKPFSVSADSVQLSRAFSNLIGNAIRYDSAGTKILISLDKNKAGNGDTRIVIADTGNSIPDDIADRIFEPFSRGDRSRPTDGGSGLGLSITDSIVRMHGWELKLETDYPGYTKAFVIRIPW